MQASGGRKRSIRVPDVEILTVNVTCLELSTMLSSSSALSEPASLGIRQDLQLSTISVTSPQDGGCSACSESRALGAGSREVHLAAWDVDLVCISSLLWHSSVLSLLLILICILHQSFPRPLPETFCATVLSVRASSEGLSSRRGITALCGTTSPGDTASSGISTNLSSTSAIASSLNPIILTRAAASSTAP